MWQTSAQCCKMVSIRGQYGLFCGKKYRFSLFCCDVCRDWWPRSVGFGVINFEYCNLKSYN